MRRSHMIASVALFTSSSVLNAQTKMTLVSSSSEIKTAGAEVVTKTTDINWNDAMRFVAVTVVNVEDYRTTREGLRIGARELVLPKSLVASRGGFLAYKGAVVGAEIVGSVYLIKHHHRTLATTLDWTSIALGALFDASNMRTIEEQKARNSRLIRY